MAHLLIFLICLYIAVRIMGGRAVVVLLLVFGGIAAAILSRAPAFAPDPPLTGIIDQACVDKAMAGKSPADQAAGSSERIEQEIYCSSWSPDLPKSAAATRSHPLLGAGD